MRKNTNSPNTLIKKSQLLKCLKNKDIQRAGPQAIKEINNQLTIFLDKLINNAKESMIINGRTTLKEEDVKNF